MFISSLPSRLWLWPRPVPGKLSLVAAREVWAESKGTNDKGPSSATSSTTPLCGWAGNWLGSRRFSYLTALGKQLFLC